MKWHLTLFQKTALVNYFKTLYKKNNYTKFDISALGLNKITQQMSQDLEALVTQQEIRDAMLSCDPIRAPRYDGFNLKCIKQVWGIIGEEFSACA